MRVVKRSVRTLCLLFSAVLLLLSARAVLADTPGKTDANPVLFLAPCGELWLFYRVGLPWAKVVLTRSCDMGRTWGRPVPLLDEPGYTFRSSILTLSGGDILIRA